MHNQRPYNIVANYIFRKKVTTFLLILSGTLTNGLVILLSLSIGTFYEMLTDRNSDKSRILHQLNIDLPHQLNDFFILFFFLVICAFLFQFLFRYGSKKIATDFSFSIRKRLFNSHIRMKPAEFSKKPIGSYLLRYSGDIKSLQTYIEKGIFQFSGDALFMGLSIGVLFYMNTQATVYVVGGLLIGFLITRGISTRVRESEKARRDLLSTHLSFVHESFSVLETIKTWNREYPTIKRFEKKTDRLVALTEKSNFWSSINYAVPFLVVFLTLMVVLMAHAGTGIVNSNSTSFVPYVLLLILLFPVAKRLMRISSVWRSGSIAIQKVTKILRSHAENEMQAMNYQPGEGKIQFHEVSFSYEAGEPFLENLNFSWQPGTINFLQGKGKSSIVKLLVGINDPTGGTIFLDGIDIKKFSLRTIRKHIAFLSEKTCLHGNTIFKCLHLRNNNHDLKEVEECLKMLGFSFSQNGNPDLHRNIGDGGRLLSRSDYKKLLLARTILSKKKIWIIDELFDDVDETCRHQLFSIFQQATAQRTIVIDEKYRNDLREKPSLMPVWLINNSQ